MLKDIFQDAQEDCLGQEDACGKVVTLLDQLQSDLSKGDLKVIFVDKWFQFDQEVLY